MLTSWVGVELALEGCQVFPARFWHLGLGPALPCGEGYRVHDGWERQVALAARVLSVGCMAIVGIFVALVAGVVAWRVLRC